MARKRGNKGDHSEASSALAACVALSRREVREPDGSRAWQDIFMTLARAIGLPASKDGTYASTSSFLLHSTVAGALASIREYPVMAHGHPLASSHTLPEIKLQLRTRSAAETMVLL